MRTCAGLLLYVLAGPFASQGQTPESGPEAPAQFPQPGSISKDRLFFALPTLLTLENARRIAPLSARKKFKVTLRSSFDPVQFVWYGSLAGISQTENSERDYPQGGAGYARRYGDVGRGAAYEFHCRNLARDWAAAAILTQEPNIAPAPGCWLCYPR